LFIIVLSIIQKQHKELKRILSISSFHVRDRDDVVPFFQFKVGGVWLVGRQ
jgi:hypothetical protein